MNVELVVAELAGFLVALQRMCGKQSEFTAWVISATESFDVAIGSYGSELLSYGGSEKVTYAQVNEILEEHIFSKLAGLGSSVKQQLHWDLIEYYGLASTALNQDGAFNPLMSEGAMLLTVSSNRYAKSSFFAVSISGYWVITGLGQRA